MMLKFIHLQSWLLKILSLNDDIGIILLDVVMETNTSGLDLVKYIREDLKNTMSRIIIRTGQHGEAPERYVIENYDINDYKEKTELTTDKLYTTIRTALAQYAHLVDLLNKKEDRLRGVILERISQFISYNKSKNEFKNLAIKVENIKSISSIKNRDVLYVSHNNKKFIKNIVK